MAIKFLIGAVLILGAAGILRAQDAADAEGSGDESTPAAETETNSTDRNGDGVESPKTMSGMSILGNEEAPKSLVIVPWKSSELGNEIKLTDTLDDRATPVDKEVFMRELRYYEIRESSH